MAKEKVEGSSYIEGPNKQIFTPSGKDRAIPVKEYPGSSKLGHEKSKGLIEGPCSGKEEYHDR